VSELTHDTTDDGFHEIQLSGKQLVALFLVTTTVIVIVFLCGVKVGRGARDAQIDEPDSAPAAATLTPPPVQTAAPPATEVPAPAADVQDDLSYHRALQGEGTPQETLKRQAEPKAAPAPPPAAALKPAPAAASPAPAPTPVATSAKVPAPAADNLPTAGRSGTWAVQVIATRDRAMAGSVLKRLAAKGYPAFLVNPPANAKDAYYKVHIGRYNDRGEAEKVSLRIKKEEQFPSWITR
jgi:cell division septation protein DedD